MAQRVSGYTRIVGEVYETPSWVLKVLADNWLCGRCIYTWDPADGPSSKLANSLRVEGFRVIATNDDFLIKRSLPDPDIEAIVMNPPYGHGGRQAHQFVAHALNLTSIVAALLKVDFDSGKTRTSLFGNCPYFAGKLILLDRITWFEPAIASPSENYAWHMWSRAHRGPPTIQYARNPLQHLSNRDQHAGDGEARRLRRIKHAKQ